LLAHLELKVPVVLQGFYRVPAVYVNLVRFIGKIDDMRQSIYILLLAVIMPVMVN